MTLPLPNLDDRTYANLVEAAISQIPLEYPEWTDHNPTDTGIILIELFAWLTEMVLYQVNQIPDENYASFLSLLQGKDWSLPTNVSPQERQKALQLEIQKTLIELRKIYRAVTPEDFEKLVLIDWNQSADVGDVKIARVKCLGQRNLESTAESFAPGHISLVVIPEDNQVNTVDKYAALLNFLDARKLLTTRLHIVEPDYVAITILAELVLQDGAQPEAVKKQVKTEVEIFFAPLLWLFGRSVYISELYKLLDDIPGVDYVENLQIIDQYNHSQSVIDLAEHQLVKINLQDSKFTILVEVGNERKTI
ncbi:baseplate J/gp47 family protein [Nostoc sp. TCL26-01]|uniref:baseplate J/gp47 family protein n=1 Tax=Nostoc sp. TCL26-01 TaxID=2576904 RepID=UPI0015BD3CDD|nr:baseplate J/gp47 family protein [Nostoc sp. TCL26-01]QLE58028.1 baseplate protein J [Nostoc sp. TCL26-01]